jgi:hypothetical protein
MKLEREKKKTFSSSDDDGHGHGEDDDDFMNSNHNHNEIKPKDPPSSSSLKIKSILKSKSSHQGGNKSSSGSSSTRASTAATATTTFNDDRPTLMNNNVKIEIVKKKRTKNNVKKVQYSSNDGTESSTHSKVVDFAAIERQVCNKEEKEGKDKLLLEKAESTTGTTEQELEDFLNSVDDIKVEEDENESNAQQDTTPTINEENKDVIEEEEYSKQNEQNIILEMEQTSYEARLAKLMLLSRKRKKSDALVVDDTVIDFTPQLAFQDSVSKHYDMKKRGRTSKEEDCYSYVEEVKGEGSNVHDVQIKSLKKISNNNSNSMKDMLKKKRSKKAKVIANHGDIGEDSFWS